MCLSASKTSVLNLHVCGLQRELLGFPGVKDELFVMQTRTPMTARITGNEAALTASRKMHALGRIGEPADIAAALAFFLDPAHAFVTGAFLNVDGGLGTVKPINK